MKYNTETLKLELSSSPHFEKGFYTDYNLG